MIGKIMQQELVINGPPVPWAAPTVTKFGSFSLKRKEKNYAVIKILSQRPKFMAGPLSVELLFFMPIPESLSEKKKQKIVNTWHIKKPDTSNLEKFTLDVLQLAGVFKNDSQVCELTVKKIYGDKPSTQITIKQLEVL